MGHPLFEVAGIRVVRDGRAILSVEKLSIQFGCHTVIKGPNGSGKSTLLGLLSGSVRPFGGEGFVRVDGQDRLSQAEWRSKVAVVRTEDGSDEFFRQATVRDVVLSGVAGTHGIVKGHHLDGSAHDAADGWISRVGMARFRDRKLATLSTGERKRALVARGLVSDPLALLMDEPMNGLDEDAVAGLRSALEAAAKRVTLLIVSHRLEDVPAIVRNVIRLREGQIQSIETAPT